ncbi:hypothetical protein [Microbacterium sp. Marseille-Q6648]|uniref:hypothetical protein n=1 Tax=Microbacterium sp. Marseille-Q6648 TaxID=2937991 RepID=UPI00203C8ABC|nr:hypothetical protein [Microbacterium sp. Marseille-Q6648]
MTGMPHPDAPTPGASTGGTAPGTPAPAPGPAAPAPGATAPAAPRRRADVLGIVAVILALVGLLPSLIIFLIGIAPEMQMIFWLLIVTLPILGIGGVIALILGVIGIIVGVRRGTKIVWSIIGVVLGILMLVPLGMLYLGPSM